LSTRLFGPGARSTDRLNRTSEAIGVLGNLIYHQQGMMNVSRSHLDYHRDLLQARNAALKTDYSERKRISEEAFFGEGRATFESRKFQRVRGPTEMRTSREILTVSRDKSSSTTATTTAASSKAKQKKTGKLKAQKRQSRVVDGDSDDDSGSDDISTDLDATGATTTATSSSSPDGVTGNKGSKKQKSTSTHFWNFDRVSEQICSRSQQNPYFISPEKWYGSEVRFQWGLGSVEEAAVRKAEKIAEEKLKGEKTVGEKTADGKEAESNEVQVGKTDLQSELERLETEAVELTKTLRKLPVYKWYRKHVKASKAGEIRKYVKGVGSRGSGMGG
jgi:hypothetical protein